MYTLTIKYTIYNSDMLYAVINVYWNLSMSKYNVVTNFVTIADLVGTIVSVDNNGVNVSFSKIGILSYNFLKLI